MGIEKKQLPPGQEPIPKKIHQVWLGDAQKIYQDRKPIYDSIHEHYPDFEYKMWSNSDVTPENFPYSYQLIQQIIEYDKTSSFGKLAAAADFMRL